MSFRPLAVCAVVICLAGCYKQEAVNAVEHRSAWQREAGQSPQAAARIATYIAQQREMLRAIGTAVADESDAVRRLADIALDAPSLGKLRLLSADTPQREVPRMLDRDRIAAALRGTEVASETYIAELSPAMDVCVPSGKPGRAVCATLDLLELQRQVQRIRVGEQGYALAFDRSGHLVAAGSGSMRAAVLSGEPVAESPFASALVKGTPAPARLRNGEGRDLIAGWASLPDLGWSIAVEQPADEALRGARTALHFRLRSRPHVAHLHRGRVHARPADADGARVGRAVQDRGPDRRRRHS